MNPRRSPDPRTLAPRARRLKPVRWRPAVSQSLRNLAVCALAATLLAGFLRTDRIATCGENARRPKLQYSWTPGKDIAYRFEIEAEVQGSVITFKGTSVYRPRVTQNRANQREETGTGTAFVVNNNGYLVTCAHVVRGGTKFLVKLGQTELPAKVLEMDRDHDLALLQVLPTSGLTVLPLGDSQKVQLAQTVRVVGYPLSTVLGNSIKITSGSIAGLVDHEGQRLFQVDAAINPGNSGGPVINDRGEVVGVASAKLAGAEISNVGFAVPAQEVRRLLERNQVIDPAMGAVDALSGPELAQRVTPGVGLITVTTGPGGLGSTEHFELGFEGAREQWKRPKKYSNDGASLVSKTDSVSGRTVTDPQGEIHDGSGSWLPLGLGPQCQVGIERLSDSAEQTTWRVRRLTTISEAISQSPMPLPNVQFRGPPFRGGPYGPAFRGGQQAMVVIPAFEQIEYQLVSTSTDGLVTIKKHYEFKVAESPGEPSPLNVTADGTLKFNIRSGAVQSLEMTGKLVSDAKNTSTTIPFSYTYQQIDPASLRTRPAGSTPAPLAVTSSPPLPSQPSRITQPSRIMETPKDRQPMPGKAARGKAAELVEEVFGEQLRKARNQKEKMALVDQLLDAAGGEKDVAQRYALLNQARLLAISTGDLAAARRAADEMINFFQIDPQKANLALLQAVAETAAGSQQAPVAEFAMTLLEESIADDRFDTAEQVAPIALQAARETGDAKLLRRFQQRGRDLKRLHKAFDAVQDDRETLERTPKQPDANLAVGKYYCLEKRDWDKGLPMLALGNDRDLKAVAEKDLASPATADQRVAVADQWWDLSDQLEGDAQEAMLGRALKWYQESMPSLAGLTRARVEKRLEKYANLIPKEKELEVANSAAGSSRANRLARNARGTLARPYSTVPAVSETFANGETAVAGGGGETFRDVGPEGSVLIGLEVGLGKFGSNDVIHSVRAIFRTRDGSEVFGKWHGQDTTRLVRVRAKSGYAIGGISAKSMALLDGFSVTFMRVGGRNLITGDSYESSWVGGLGGGRETRLGGDGTPVIGIIGRENFRDCSALGLILKR